MLANLPLLPFRFAASYFEFIRKPPFVRKSLENNCIGIVYTVIVLLGITGAHKQSRCQCPILCFLLTRQTGTLQFMQTLIWLFRTFHSRCYLCEQNTEVLYTFRSVVLIIVILPAFQDAYYETPLPNSVLFFLSLYQFDRIKVIFTGLFCI